MGVVKEIMDTLKSFARGAASVGDAVSKTQSKSFARGANDQSFQFKALVADSAPVSMASTVARHLDQLYAAFVQIYVSSVGVIDLNYVKNPRQFINMFQSKFQLEGTEEEDEELSELSEKFEDTAHVGDALYAGKDIWLLFGEGVCSPTMRKNLQEGMYTVDNLYNIQAIPSYVREAEDITGDDVKSQILDSFLDKKKGEINKDKMDVYAKTGAPRLTERDVKKLNDMQPYVLELNILATKGESGLSRYLKFFVGVKTDMTLGDSDKMVKNIVYVLKNRRPMFNFIRWTTGEISLLKDIIFNINDINFEIVNKNNPTGRFFTALKRMKKKPVKINRDGLSRTAPLATLIITSYEYNIILNEYGFDLRNLTIANKLMKELYLMCFVIMDEGTQTLDILLDGNTSGFQTYSLEILEKETSLNSSKLSKELTRMLGGN